jgi:ParB family chromosome partitioning protein
MATDKYLSYRGDVKALAVSGGALAFVTVHPEGKPTPLYRLDPEKLTLSEADLPLGGQVLLALGDELWVGGSDQCVYPVPPGGAPTCRTSKRLDAPIVALAPLANERLAVAAGARVIVSARGDRSTLQTLELPDPVTALASDPTGQWLAVGTAKGTVSVFECETDAATFQMSDSAPLHEAAVTALLFEADELRFLSAGADQKLLSTHARGRLEAEDRGRGANHEQPITAMIAGTNDRFLTGSSDATVKSWPRAKGARPVTLKDGVGKVIGLAVVPVHGKPQVVVACDDNTLRFFQLDEEGKFGDGTVVVHGADAWAKNELAQSDPKRREAALRALAEWSDGAAIKRIAAQMTGDADHALRLLACRLLGESAHPRAAKALEKGLEHKDEAVRLLAFEGLRRHAGPTELRPLILALKANKADVGVRAVEALETLAAKDDQAMAQLTGALQSNVAEVRRAALASLEKVHGRDSPEASLTALGSPHADLRRLALLRLLQRRLLHDPRAQAALRWRGDDPDPEVRRVAFLLSLHTREKLLKALRQRDSELDRQLTELASGTLPKMEEAAGGKKGRASKATAATAVPPSGMPALTDPETFLQQIEEFGRQGVLPPEMVAQVRQLLEGDPATLAQVAAMMRGPLLEQIRQFRQRETGK